MYLVLPNLRMPNNAYRLCCSPHGTPEDKVVGSQQPKYLVPLGEALWSEDVVVRIAGIFSEVGFEDPRRQKLVEPYAIVFGGKSNDGVPELSNVNWELLVDYMRFEAAGVIERDKHKIEVISEEMWCKHSTLVSHYEVYENPEFLWHW